MNPRHAPEVLLGLLLLLATATAVPAGEGASPTGSAPSCRPTPCASPRPAGSSGCRTATPCAVSSGLSPMEELEARVRQEREGFLGTSRGSCELLLGLALGLAALLSAAGLVLYRSRRSAGARKLAVGGAAATGALAIGTFLMLGTCGTSAAILWLGALGAVLLGSGGPVTASAGILLLLTGGLWWLRKRRGEGCCHGACPPPPPDAEDR